MFVANKDQISPTIQSETAAHCNVTIVLNCSTTGFQQFQSTVGVRKLLFIILKLIVSDSVWNPKVNFTGRQTW